MLTHAANVFCYKLPPLGAIVTVQTRPLMIGHRWRRFRVESFPASRDLRHCANLSALDNGWQVTVSGHLCVEN